MDQLEISGRTAVVTGAASGIGKVLTLMLADRGADLVLADIDEEGLAQVASLAEAKGARVLTRRVDAGSAADNEALAQEAFAWAQAPIALVFANAGILGMDSAIAPDADFWERSMRVNLFGPINMARAFLSRLVTQNVPAQFVITGSGASFVGAAGISAYAAAKHALWGYAECLRCELSDANSAVQVSLVAPGRTLSKLTLAQTERIRAAQGYAAADAYRKFLVDTETAVEVILREVANRSFIIVPSGDDLGTLLAERIREVQSAIARDEIAI